VRRIEPPLLAALALVLLSTSGTRAGDDDRPDPALRRTPVVNAVERASPSVVSIGTTEFVRVPRFWEWDVVVRERQGALGSGVIVHPRGYVVTNAHVINKAAKIAVKLTGLGKEEELPTTLIAVDLGHDLALLRIDAEGPYPIAKLGRSDDLMVGETAIAMGNPFGLGRTVTVGVISALNRELRIEDQLFEGLIQTDAAVNQGNSGGALLNILGEWVGVNSAIYSLSGGSDGISFAIPIETVRAFLVEAMRPRRVVRRWLGMEFDESENGDVVVGTVYRVGPAAEAGVKEGSTVLDAEGRPWRDLLALTYAVLDSARGGTYELRLRDGDRMRSTAIPFSELPTRELAWARIGVEAADVTPEITERTGFPEASGVLVTAIREGSAAARMGFRMGDLLMSFDNVRIRTQDDLLVLLETIRPGDPVDIHLARPKRTRHGRVVHETWKARLVAD